VKAQKPQLAVHAWIPAHLPRNHWNYCVTFSSACSGCPLSLKVAQSGQSHFAKVHRWDVQKQDDPGIRVLPVGPAGGVQVGPAGARVLLGDAGQEEQA